MKIFFSSDVCINRIVVEFFLIFNVLNDCELFWCDVIGCEGERRYLMGFFYEVYG